MHPSRSLLGPSVSCWRCIPGHKLQAGGQGNTLHRGEVLGYRAGRTMHLGAEQVENGQHSKPLKVMGSDPSSVSCFSASLVHAHSFSLSFPTTLPVLIFVFRKKQAQRGRVMSLKSHSGEERDMNLVLPLSKFSPFFHLK